MKKLIQNYKKQLTLVKNLVNRKFYNDFKMNHRFIGIVGARGVGKTTFLLNYLKSNYLDNEKALYVSADNLYFAENNLVDLVDQFIKIYGGEILCIDEIHKYKNWNQELKNIYDLYPGFKIIFSGSSSINLIKGKYDLSRRVILKKMSGFSFLEYLEFQTKLKFKPLTLDELISNKNFNQISETEKILGHFKNYLKQGYYPTFIEITDLRAYQETLINILDKNIFEDISSFYSLKTQNLDILRKIIYFFATSDPGSININKLASSLGKDHTTISGYIQILKDIEILIFLLNDKYGHSLVRNAEKIYLSNTNLLYAINNAIGKQVNIGLAREIFVISSLENAGYDVFYSKVGDIVCNDYIFEIGGANKTKKQIKDVKNSFLVKDDVLYKAGRDIPIFMFGFLG